MGINRMSQFAIGQHEFEGIHLRGQLAHARDPISPKDINIMREGSKKHFIKHIKYKK